MLLLFHASRLYSSLHVRTVSLLRRTAELARLDAALRGGPESVIALIGPGGQGKTAIVQHWLESMLTAADRPEGVFLWSFYRGKDADLCLRSLYAYAEGLEQPPDLSASYCVDHLLPLLRRQALGDRARWHRGSAVRQRLVAGTLPAPGTR